MVEAKRRTPYNLRALKMGRQEIVGPADVIEINCSGAQVVFYTASSGLQNRIATTDSDFDMWSIGLDSQRCGRLFSAARSTHLCPPECVLYMAIVSLLRRQNGSSGVEIVLSGRVLEICAHGVVFWCYFPARGATECSCTVCGVRNSAVGALSLNKNRQFINLWIESERWLVTPKSISRTT